MFFQERCPEIDPKNYNTRRMPVMRIIYALSLGIVLFSGCGKKSGKDSQSSGPAGAVTVTGQLVLPQGSASTLPDQLGALPLISAMSGAGSAGGTLVISVISVISVEMVESWQLPILCMVTQCVPSIGVS
jgi:hypothetical protein